MNFNFDFKNFQKESMEKLSKIYAEALINQEEVFENTEIYKKMEKILHCKEMEKCHPYLFSLNRECLNEEECKKIEQLYECGFKRGFLVEDDIEDCEDEFFDDDQLCGGPDDSLTGQNFDNPTKQYSTDTKSFTILYSAVKNGDTKTGEFYSVCSDEKEAKQDCITQLTTSGYDNIEIMAVEQLNTTDNVEKHNSNEPSDDSKQLTMFAEDDSQEYEEQETNNDELMDKSKELTVDEKNTLKTEYTKVFKDVLKKLEFDKSFSEMTLDEKINFLKELTTKWDKNDPVEFLDKKEQDKLNTFTPEIEDTYNSTDDTDDVDDSSDMNDSSDNSDDNSESEPAEPSDDNSNDDVNEEPEDTDTEDTDTEDTVDNSEVDDNNEKDGK